MPTFLDELNRIPACHRVGAVLAATCQLLGLWRECSLVNGGARGYAPRFVDIG